MRRAAACASVATEQRVLLLRAAHALEIRYWTAHSVEAELPVVELGLAAIGHGDVDVSANYGRLG
jgi:hypothetical protein